MKLAGRGFELLDPWVGGVTLKRRFKCAKGHTWETTLNSVLGHNKTGCPTCRKQRNGSPEQRLAELGFILVGDFKNVAEKCTVRCPQGHEWEARVHNILGPAKTGCPICLRVTREEAAARLESRGIELVGEYINTQVSTKFRGPCGHEWVTTPNNVLNGSKSGCPTCATSGFKPEVPAYVYVVSLESTTGNYVGFGITKNLKARLGRHRTSATRAGVLISTIHTRYFADGREARSIEKKALEMFDTVDTGVEGFRKEATSIANLPHLLAIVNGGCREII